MITSEQIRAARALVGWTQGELAEHIGMTQANLNRIENRLTAPKQATISAISETFELQGLEFKQGGVVQAEKGIHEISGDDWYLRLLDDVYASIKRSDKKDFWVLFGSDALSPPEVIERCRRIRSLNVDMRQLVKQGETYLMGALEEYRYIPTEDTAAVCLVYADKFAVCANDETKALVINDPRVANSQRNWLNFVWSILETPKESTADERY